MNTLKTTIGALAMLLVLTVLPACLDNISDHSHEAAEYENLKAAIEAEESAARREAAAWMQCRETQGESIPVWTVDGQLSCKARRGNLKAKVLL